MDEKLKGIVEKAVEGDTKAFEDLIMRKQRDILYIAKYYSNQQSVEDCVQEAIYHMFREIKKLRNPDSFDTWMYRIIQNTCTSALRKQKRKTVPIESTAEYDIVEELDASFLPMEYVEDKERRKVIMETIQGLPENYQDCLLLYYYQRMNYREMSQFLGVNEGKIANDLTRARRLVKSGLEKRFGKEFALSAAPIGIIPVFSRLFEAEAEAFAGSELGKEIASQMTDFRNIPGISAPKQVAKGVSKPVKLMISGAVVVAGVIGIAYATQTKEQPVTETVVKAEQASVAELTEETAEATEPEEKRIETIEDMIGEDYAKRLYQYEEAQTDEQSWIEFLNQIGADQDMELTNMEGYTFRVYVLEKQECRLILLSKTQVESGQTEVQYRFGGLNLEIPSDLEVTFLFLSE